MVEAEEEELLLLVEGLDELVPDTVEELGDVVVEELIDVIDEEEELLLLVDCPCGRIPP